MTETVWDSSSINWRNMSLADELYKQPNNPKYFDCKVKQTVDAGDHVLVVCEVIDAGYLQQGKPMLYCETGDMDGSSKLF